MDLLQRRSSNWTRSDLFGKRRSELINIARGIAPGAGGEEDMEADEGGITIQSASAAPSALVPVLLRYQVQHHVQLCRSLSDNVQREQGKAHEI